MKFNLIFIFIFISTAIHISRQHINSHIKLPPPFRILMKSIFNQRQLFLRELARLLKEQELLREQEKEEKQRNIINENLTKGNSFMRDFYSGRY